MQDRVAVEQVDAQKRFNDVQSRYQQARNSKRRDQRSSGVDWRNDTDPSLPFVYQAIQISPLLPREKV